MTIWELIALAKSGGGASPVFHFKGSVLNESALPATGEEGDTYLVDSADSYFAWDGEGWTDIGQVLSMDDVEELFGQLEDEGDRQVARIEAAADSILQAVETKAPAIYETASGSIASFPDGADNMPLKSLIVNIEPVQAGSGDPSPTNIRPISGWTGCNISHCGFNLFDGITGNYSTNNDGVDAPGINARSTGFIPTPFDSLRIVPTYVEGITFPLASGLRLIRFDENKSFINREIRNLEIPLSRVWDVTNCAYIKVQWFVSDIENVDIKKDGDPDGAIGDSYPISWQTEAGTIYVGKINATTGVLIGEWAANDLAEIVAGVNENGVFYGNVNGKAVGNSNLRASCYKTSSSTSNAGMVDFEIKGSPANKNIYIKDSRTIDVNELKSLLAGQKIISELETPISYQLTPQEVTTLLGTNNIWADCGPVNVTYPSDTKLYIDGKIAELQALVLENIGG